MEPKLGFSIGSDVCPGLSKLVEECGEVLQVAGKLIATGGKSDHWDGTALWARMEEELADLTAAIDFFRIHNNFCPMTKRYVEKMQRFQEWHEKQKAQKI